MENHGNGIGTFFILMMPTSVAGEMITILCFLAKKQQSAFQDLRKEETHKLTKLCCLLSARHLENNCLSSCQAISQAGEIARVLRIDLTKFKAEGEFTERTGIETSKFYPKLPAGVRQRQW